jgi:hypothetical protein
MKLNNLVKSAVLLFAALALLRCGVKGDPLPPEQPPEMGRGRPTFKRAFDEIRVESDPAPQPDPAKVQPTVQKQEKENDEDSDSDEE